MQFQDILYEVTDGVAVIRFNRPEAMNAARLQTHLDLYDALEAADADDAVRAVVVTGAGRAFCAGTDISGGFDLPTGGDPVTGEGVPPDVGGRVVLRLFRMSKPVAAAINGPAAGFGATFTLAMDVRFAAEGAKFAFPFSRRAICVESCSSWFLPRLVGIQTAQDWMLSGRTFLAAEALAKGLVLEVLPPAEVLDRAMAWARDIAQNCAPASVAVNRRMLWQMMGADHPVQAHQLESRAIAALLAQPDVQEGVASFRERRAPQFSGTVANAGFLQAWWPDKA